MKFPQHIRSLRVGDATVELIESKQHEFIGLGGVQIGGVPLRGDTRPITVRLDTPDGILYPRFIVKDIQRQRDRVHISLQAVGLPWGRGEYQDDYNQSLYHLGRNGETLTDRLTLTLAPAQLTLAGRAFTGFSYSFGFVSATRQIHRLLTHATWEIGGRITGNTVLSQGQCNMPVYHGAKRALFTTACLRRLDQYGSMQGYSFQLAARAGLVQGFDFQHSRQGVLFQYWPDFQSVSSLCESPRGEDVLHVVDEYRFPLARRVTTTPKQVLFHRGGVPEHESRDLWLAAYDHVYGGIKRRCGIQPTLVLPEADRSHASRFVGAQFQIKMHGEWVDHTEVLYALADKSLPALARQGIKRIFPMPAHQTDVTELGLRRKLDDGVHGDLHCASVCASHRFFPSDFWGGIKAWRYLARKARGLGIEIGAWFAPHFSPRAAIFEKHPDWRIVDINGLPAGGGYGFQTLAVADWNTGVYDWVLDDLRRWQEEGGLDYLFTDSFSNLGLLQCNYGAGMRTNLEAFGRLYADLQRIKIKSFAFESISPYGSSYFGVADLRGDLMEQDKAVAGQNDFGWWVGEEDMAHGICLCVPPRKRSAAELERIMFRVLANRGYVMYQTLLDEQSDGPAWHRQLNHLYNQALPHMQGQRRLLPQGAGVRWESPQGNLTWTFKNCPVQSPCYRLDGHNERAWTKPVLPAWNVFRSI